MKLSRTFSINDGDMAYPTETFYGLGVLAFSEKAIEKVYRLKKSERGKPCRRDIAISRWPKRSRPRFRLFS